MTQKTSPASLSWLLDDLLDRVSHAHHAIVLSADGLLMASSAQFGKADGEHLAAVAAGIQSLAKGAAERFDGGPIRQTIVEMQDGFLLVTAAGKGACLAALAGQEAEIGNIAYELNMMATKLHEHLTSPARAKPGNTGQGAP